MHSSLKIKEPWLTIITVTYNSSSVIQDFISSLPVHEKDNVEVIFVDNNSQDDSVSIIKKNDCRVLSLESNVGFGAANNKGAACAKTDFLFFVNPDCQFESDTLAQMKKGIDNHPDAVAFNPRIINNGKPYFRQRSNLLPKSKHWNGPFPKKDAIVPILSGSSILCARDLFEEIKGFDDNIFLYYEDDDISLRFAKKGTLMMIYDAVIHHHFGHASGRDPKTAWFKGYHMTRSLAYASRKHGLSWSSNKQKVKLYLSFLMPHILFNKRRRSKYLGMLKGLSEVT
ncbi:MAG: glycosyltransferase family 2 protein [Cocleimonas sp.]